MLAYLRDRRFCEIALGVSRDSWTTIQHDLSVLFQPIAHPEKKHDKAVALRRENSCCAFFFTAPSYPMLVRSCVHAFAAKAFRKFIRGLYDMLPSRSARFSPINSGIHAYARIALQPCAMIMAYMYKVLFARHNEYHRIHS